MPTPADYAPVMTFLGAPAVAVILLVLGLVALWLRAGQKPLRELPALHQQNTTRLDEIHEDMTKVLDRAGDMAVRVRAMEQWQVDHEARCNERLTEQAKSRDTLRGELAALRDDLRVTRESVHAVRNELTTYLLKERTVGKTVTFTKPS